MRKILILNGPNLNLLGRREPNIYGNQTLNLMQDDILANKQKDDVIDFMQSNSEGKLIDVIQDADNEYAGIVFNPGGYSHTSIAIMDAIKAISIPVVEVHVTNIFSREIFRHDDVIANACIGQICGFGLHSYVLGYQALCDFLNKERQNDN